MAIPDLADRLPDYAKDLKKNLSRIVEDKTLTETQLWGTILVAALATRQPDVIREARAEAARHLTPDDIEAWLTSLPPASPANRSALPESGSIIVSLEQWQAHRDALLARGTPLGIKLASDQSPEAIADEALALGVDRIGLIRKGRHSR